MTDLASTLVPVLSKLQELFVVAGQRPIELPQIVVRARASRARAREESESESEGARPVHARPHPARAPPPR